MTSCIEEENEQTAELVNSEILAAKTWYESVESQSSGTENARKVKNGKGKPDWAKSKAYTQADGKRVIEVQFDFEEISIPEHLKTDKLEKNSVLQTLILFPKSNGTYVSYFLNIFPDSPDKKFNTEDFIEGGYQKIPSDFSGVYRFYRWNGKFISGWHIKDGEKTHRIKEGNLPIKNSKGSRISSFTMTCYQVVTTWYQYTCSVTGGCSIPMAIGQTTAGYACELVLSGPTTGGDSGGGGGGSPDGSNENCEVPEGNLEGVTMDCDDEEVTADQIIEYLEDNYNRILNACEKDLIRSSPIYMANALNVFYNPHVAQLKTEQIFGYNGLNDCSDAFRHSYWNALNTTSVGISSAILFGAAHKCGSPSSNLGTSMDYFNNEVGRQIGSSNPDATSEMLSSITFQALVDGDLTVISNLRGGGRIGLNSELINSSICQN